MTQINPPTQPDDEPIKLEIDDLEPIVLEQPIDEEPIVLVEEDEEPISLVEPSENNGDHVSIVHKKKQETDEQKFTRPLKKSASGATRCRLFHSKLAQNALAVMERQINEWIDGDEDIDIKHVGHVVGNIQTKTSTEENIFVMVWY